MQQEAARNSSLSEFRFSDQDFQSIARIAYKEAGLNLSENKRSLVYSRLTKRLRALTLPDFASYVELLESQSGGEEINHLLTSLTTNVTAFFREAHHFQHLRQHVLPGLIESARAGSRVRFWSAASSSGEEAFSIALCVLELCPEADGLDIRILGTDIDENMIERARAGRFPENARQSIPAELARLLGRTKGGDSFDMPPAARALCRFNRLNLLGEWPFHGKFDVIFCRNVAIYFDADTQTRLWSRLNEMLNDCGHLYIGHSERIAGPAETHLRSTGITQYQKASAQVTVGTKMQEE